MTTIDDILSFNKPLASEVCKGIADRVKARRLEMNLTQTGMCAKAGVTLASYRRFERTGLISLEGLAKIALVLDMEDDLQHLFSQKKYTTLDDVVAETTHRKRQRGKKNE